MGNTGMPTIIFGSGGASREVYYLIKQVNQACDSPRYHVLGFVENDKKKIGDHVCDNKIVISDDISLPSLLSDHSSLASFIPIGEPRIKEQIYNSIKGFPDIIFPNIIHPSVVYDEDVLAMGEGNIICAGNIIGSSLTLGSFNLINRSCTIGHDVTAENFNTINPMSAISGDVSIGNKNLIGAGATILQGLHIGDNVTIGAGAVLTKNACNEDLLVGVPAKKRNVGRQESSKVYIIAEAGVNHNGDIETAKRLADAARNAGANAVKYQTFITEEVISKNAKKVDYQMRATGGSESQFEMVKKLELSQKEFIDLKEYCDSIGITFLSTPFDRRSIQFLKELDMDKWKIPSGEITNLPYLIQIAQFGNSVFLSTGMSTIDEIRFAVQVLTDNGCGDITLLHCNTDYPTKFEDANIRAMLELRDKFGLKVGFSDHTLGIEAAVAAVALGAAVIEKHFTLDRGMEGPDHQASLDPIQLQQMVKSIRNLEKALGSGIKIPSKSEIKNKDQVRKSIVASRNIKKGEIFSEENLAVKRPGTGLSPVLWFDVLGEKAARDFKEDELIEL